MQVIRQETWKSRIIDQVLKYLMTGYPVPYNKNNYIKH